MPEPVVFSKTRYIKLFAEAKRRLAEVGVESYEAEARLMFEKLGITLRRMYLFDGTASEEFVGTIHGWIDRRAKGEPVQYITGEADFMDLKISVRPGVLIPRLDTEVLGYAALELIRPSDKVLDMGTGSGCLAVALKHRIPDISMTAADIDPVCLEVARENAQRHSVSGIEFAAGDMFAAVTGRVFDVIVCNPPYIRSQDIAGLATEVRDYEPRIALDGGQYGLDFYRVISRDAPRHLNAGGRIALEVGHDQADAVSDLLRDDFCEIRHIADVSGIKRVVTARLK